MTVDDTDFTPDLGAVRRGLAEVGENEHAPAIDQVLTGVIALTDAALLLLPPDRPGWHSVPDREPIDGGWTAGSDRITVDNDNPGRLLINDPGLHITWSATTAEVREYAGALLSAAARAEQAANDQPSTTTTSPETTQP